MTMVTNKEATDYVKEYFSDEVVINLVINRRGYVDVKFTLKDRENYKGVMCVYRLEDGEVYGEW